MKSYTNEMLLHELMKENPLWPATFGPCINADDGEPHKPARGGGYCVLCYMREMVRRGCNADEVEFFQSHVHQTTTMYHELLGQMED